jgi:hypothetical protein
MNELTKFEPAEILRVLAEHDVEFVVIGGMAAALHGADYITVDLDVTPRRTLENLDRVSSALEVLDARIRVVGIPDGLPFSHDGRSLGQSAVWNLQTRFGDLDLAMEPAGFDGGWDDLHPGIVVVHLGGVPTEVAGLADVITSKAAADRPKDRAMLPTLRALLARQRRAVGPE